jgi:hypothetical protein
VDLANRTQVIEARCGCTEVISVSGCAEGMADSSAALLSARYFPWENRGFTGTSLRPLGAKIFYPEIRSAHWQTTRHMCLQRSGWYFSLDVMGGITSREGRKYGREKGRERKKEKKEERTQVRKKDTNTQRKYSD